MKHINKNDLKGIVSFIEKIIDGTDPISNTKLSEDTVLNNKKYREVFCDTCEALNYLIKNVNIKGRWDKRKIDFYIYELEAQKIKISNDPISVSELTYNINAVIDNYQMKKLKATQITKWLEYNGYLQSDINEKTFHKICTEKAINIGIYRVKKINSYNETYYVNLYRDIAQKFIIKNINNISGAIIE